MMLNSIIIEGDFVHFTTKKGELPLGFLIENNGIIIPIKTTGKLADACVDYLHKGRGLRIVGKLSKDKHLSVMAEHIEFKSVKPKGTTSKN